MSSVDFGTKVVTVVLAASSVSWDSREADPDHLPSSYRAFVDEMRNLARIQDEEAIYFYWICRSQIAEQANRPGFLGWALEF